MDVGTRVRDEERRVWRGEKDYSNTHNPRIQALRELNIDTQRPEKTGLFLLEGPHLLEALLNADVLPKRCMCSLTFCSAR